jgi:hypothetical protein
MHGLPRYANVLGNFSERASFSAQATYETKPVQIRSASLTHQRSTFHGRGRAWPISSIEIWTRAVSKTICLQASNSAVADARPSSEKAGRGSRSATHCARMTPNARPATVSSLMQRKAGACAQAISASSGRGPRYELDLLYLRYNKENEGLQRLRSLLKAEPGYKPSHLALEERSSSTGKKDRA